MDRLGLLLGRGEARELGARPEIVDKTEVHLAPHRST